VKTTTVHAVAGENIPAGRVIVLVARLAQPGDTPSGIAPADVKTGEPMKIAVAGIVHLGLGPFDAEPPVLGGP
jgi:hypothetical protein